MAFTYDLFLLVYFLRQLKRIKNKKVLAEKLNPFQGRGELRLLVIGHMNQQAHGPGSGLGFVLSDPGHFRLASLKYLF